MNPSPPSRRPGAPERIETARLVLRAPTLDDVDGYAGLYADAATARFLGEHGTDARDAVVEFAVDFERGWSIHWSAVDRADASFIGYVALHAPATPTPYVSYAVVPDKRRRNYAAEAVRAVMDYAAALPHVDGLLAHVHLDNEPSAALLRSLGFAEEARVTLPTGPRRQFRWVR